MSEADNPTPEPRHEASDDIERGGSRASDEDRSFQNLGAEGAPNGGDRSRGTRADDPSADSVLPGREYGAGGQVDDGPNVEAGGAIGSDEASRREAGARGEGAEGTDPSASNIQSDGG